LLSELVPPIFVAGCDLRQVVIDDRLMELNYKLSMIRNESLKADIDTGTDAFDDIWNLSKGDLLSYVLLHCK
jgi:hypothetical protein